MLLVHASRGEGGIYTSISDNRGILQVGGHEVLFENMGYGRSDPVDSVGRLNDSANVAKR